MQGGAPVMDRLPPPGLLSSPREQPGGQNQNTTWVPDEEVKECPLCARAFTAFFRKHHCRACGRIVCSHCSNNSLSITGAGKKDRVCDRCFDLRRHDQTATLADNQSSVAQMEQNLKSDLKLKHQQAEWFRSFLVRVIADAPRDVRKAARAAAVNGDEPPGSMSPEGSSSPRSPSARSPAGSFCGEDEGAELQGLINTARGRWTDVCNELGRREAETARLRRECEQLEKQCQAHQAKSKELRREVQSMQTDLKKRPEVEVERDQLQLRTASLQRELDGLNQRKASLEASRPSPPGSFMSVLSGSSGSLGGSLGQIQERMRGCTNRCHQQ